MRIRVYRNLRRKCYSIQADGRVIDYAPTLWLQNVTFLVSEGGRERALREGRRNVHAYAVGEVCEDPGISAQGSEVRYNPFRWRTFVDARTHKPIRSAAFVYLGLNGVYAYQSSPTHKAR